MLRINTRYLEEVVEAHNVCPYARGARSGGAVARRVLWDEAPSVTSALSAITELEAESETVVALLIYPRLGLPPVAFDRLMSEVREADLARRPDARTGPRAPFAMAAFHPDAGYGDENPQRMVTFFRRAPDPTIQLVRFSALDAVKGSVPQGAFFFEWSAAGLLELERRTSAVPVSERIARDNFATAARVGIARLQAIYDDIAADRARSYARFISSS